MKPYRLSLAACMRCGAVAAALVCAGTAQAVVQSSAVGVADYGNGGNIFQVQPMLFIQGLGNANTPGQVVVLNPALHESSVVSGLGTSMMTIDYLVHNTSATESFSDLRFMFFANPDGDAVNFLDRLSENWVSAAPGEPTRREGREFSFDPNDIIFNRFRVNNNLTEGASALDATCTVAAGCDATFALQWNEPTLGPGETLQVRVGLSDDGSALSSNWLRATAVNSPSTALTLSGVSAVLAVPEADSVWMLGSGLAMLTLALRRRRRGARQSDC